MTQMNHLTLEELLNRLPQPLYYANRRQAVLNITKAHNGAWFVAYDFKPDAIVRSGKTLAEAAAGMLEWLGNPKNIQTYQIKGNETNN